ncbi:MAG: hypothetical protein V2I46_10725 [Bacteroides sp.]|jgi:hypothetical protein|nr:hypothetical protein [Bacteroides sp.]
MLIQKRNDFLCFGLLISAVVAVHYVIAWWPDVEMLQSQKSLFSWKAIGIIGSLGFFSVYLLNLTGLKKLWDGRVGLNYKITLPFVTGLLLGVIHSTYDLFSGAASEIAATMGLENIHIAFPFSIPVYSGGAILVNTIYYLIPIPILVFLVSTKILKGKAESIVFWTVGILIALFEPLTNPGVSVLKQVGPVAIPLSVSVLVFNLVTVLFIRKYGFVSAYFLRFGHYAVWHILYPII